MFIFFSRITGQFSTKLGTKHPCMKEIHVCIIKWSRSLTSAENFEIAKIHSRNLKIFYSRTTGQISAKLGTTHPWANGIQIYLNEGPHPVPRGDNYEIARTYWPVFMFLWFFFQVSDWPIGLLCVLSFQQYNRYNVINLFRNNENPL